MRLMRGPYPTFHKDGTVTFDGGTAKGFWTRHYNGRVDRGVKLGTWQGCFAGGPDSPIFNTRRDLIFWFISNYPEDKQ